MNVLRREKTCFFFLFFFFTINDVKFFFADWPPIPGPALTSGAHTPPLFKG